MNAFAFFSSCSPCLCGFSIWCATLSEAKGNKPAAHHQTFTEKKFLPTLESRLRPVNHQDTRTPRHQDTKTSRHQDTKTPRHQAPCLLCLVLSVPLCFPVPSVPLRFCFSHHPPFQQQRLSPTFQPKRYYNRTLCLQPEAYRRGADCFN